MKKRRTVRNANKKCISENKRREKSFDVGNDSSDCTCMQNNNNDNDDSRLAFALHVMQYTGNYAIELE